MITTLACRVVSELLQGAEGMKRKKGKKRVYGPVLSDDQQNSSSASRFPQFISYYYFKILSEKGKSLFSSNWVQAAKCTSQ
jgi:hypothetical protein